MYAMPSVSRHMICPASKRLLVSFVALCAIGWSAFATAGGGPENVLLVVNPNSRSSLTIANHYARLRNIPDSNMLFVPWDKATQTADIQTFRKRILLPVIEAIHKRRLAGQIDYIVYSSDFPWGISLDNDTRQFAEQLRKQALAEKKKSNGDKKGKVPKAEDLWPKQLTPTGSLNGLTYLWQPVLAGVAGYFNPHSNLYACEPGKDRGDRESAGFRSSRMFGKDGKIVSSEGQRYFLSVVLGVTAGRGNSVDEVLDYLRRSESADGTRPDGTIYFVENGDIRSQARHWMFPSAVSALDKLGVDGEIVRGAMPRDKSDVQGCVMGTANFNWRSSGSTILPGAICEHFTSFGGVMRKDSNQTPLSEFLRYGAAGASGTVAEPYAIAAKFPSPMVQVHYARGCTLAEAFYQSVASPYQLLIVGDPLCRPWARIPKVSVEGVEPGATIKGKLELKPSAVLPDDGLDSGKIEWFELFADGRRIDRRRPGENLSLDTTKFADGYHDLRVVAIGPSPIESQGESIIPVRVANHQRTIEATLATDEPLGPDKPVVISVNSPNALGIVVLHGSRVVGRLRGDQGRIEIPPNILGSGPVRLLVVGIGGGGTLTNVAAEPLEFTL